MQFEQDNDEFCKIRDSVRRVCSAFPNEYWRALDEKRAYPDECIGDAKWFTRTAGKYANERRVFDRLIGENQGVQFPIAKAYVQMRAADASWEATNACLQTHGGFGFADEYGIELKFRETRLYQVAPISTNLILSFVAEHVLGLPRSY
jgi:acyl-CoA dehydrogenase